MKDHLQNLGYWVKRYSTLANEAVDTALRPYGIGRSQWYLLFHLPSDGSLSQRELQDILQVESATLTSLVAPLVKKGLIQQDIDQSNKRHKVITLTAAGRILKQRIPDPFEQARAKAHRNITDEDLIAAREVLKIAVQNLEQKI